jgi:hypothetical protein
MFASGYWQCCNYIKNVHTILEGQGRRFLEESYSYLVPIVENIYSDIDVKNSKLR